MTLFLHLFGRPRIARDGSNADLPCERRHQVLVYLSLQPGWVSRSDLAAMLWPGQPSKLALNNLRKTLHRLQDTPWASSLESQANALRFEVPTDVAQFESALREGRAADVLRLHEGTLLEGYEQDDSDAWSAWLSFERARLRAAWRGVALERMAGDIAPADAVALSARLLQADPIDEDALRAHMQWLARAGQAATARAAYREFTERLRRDWGLAPSKDLQAFHDSLDGAAPPTPARAAPSPAAQDGFVGRSAELRQIRESFDNPACRLLCIVGPGGVGKTSLARHALQALAPAYPDGAVFVALEQARAPGDVPLAIARALGVAAGAADPQQAILDHLRGRRVLLALDNFEHLAGASASIEELLAACTGVRVIVTSRVRLGVAMEWSLPLDGLPCPDAEDGDRIEAFDAAQLFLRSAQRVAPGLNSASEAEAIIDICRQVEGLPLALELAAAWTRVLSCAEIAAELRGGTELLRSLNAQRPARHASMEVVFDQSWALLGPAEREALARLSVFQGGFTAEAAALVAQVSLPVLGSLADQSLLRREAGRLIQHPMIPQLAAARLEAASRFEAEAAHAQYFHRLLAQAQRQITLGERDVLARLDLEFENVRSAWRWAIAQGEFALVLRSIGSLRNYCDHRGRVREGWTLMREALDANPAPDDPGFTPLLLASIAHLEHRLDRYAEAIATANRALEASKASRDAQARLQCFKVLGAAYLRLADYTQARKNFKRALDQAPAAVDPRNAAAMLDNLALVEKLTGRYREAREMSLQALEQFRRVGDAAGEALCLNNLGAMLNNHREFEGALPHLRAALAVCDRHGFATTRSYVLANLAEAFLGTGELAQAHGQAQAAIDAARQMGNRAVESWSTVQLARIEAREGNLEDARVSLRRAIEIATALDRPALLIDSLLCFAELLMAMREGAAAASTLSFIASHPACDAVQKREAAALAETARHGPAVPPPLTLAEFTHRVVIEQPLAHAPLIAVLRPGS